MSPMPPSKYRDFNVFKKDVEKLWREYGKFPSNDFLRGLKRFDLIKGFKYHGGFRNVRGVMEAPPTESPYRDFAKLETELRKLVEKHGELSNPILKREKRGDLISAIDNFHGGLNAVRKKMGLPVVLTPKPLSPMRDWSFFSIELKKWMEAHEGGFPTHAQLQAEKRSDLILGMNTHEGYPAVRERMGIEPEKNPFTEFNNLRKALAPIIKMHGGKYPSPAHITKNHPELEHAIRYYHGGHVATRLRLGVEPVGRPPHPFEDKETFLNALKAVRERLGRQPTQDDLIAEKRFDILYFLNKKTHGTYSEIKKDLRWLKEPKPKRRKLKFSSKEEFMDQLRGIRTEFGRRPTQEEVFRIGGRNFATAIRNKHYGSWDAIVDKLGWEQTFYTNQFRNEGNAVAAIAPVVETLGRFPKREELRSMGLGSLVYAISTWHGGLEAFKKKAGFPSKKMKRRSSYADPQNLVTELQKIFGSRDVSTPLLIQLKRFDLLYGIEVNGGLSQVWKGMREMRRYSELKEESPTYIAVAEVVAAAKGDTEALDVVLKKMDPLIRRFARKKIVEGYRGMERSALEFNDLVQVGRMAVITKVKDFDPLRGRSFKTFIGPYLKGWMDRARDNLGFQIRVSIPTLDDWNKMQNRIIDFEKEHGRRPRVRELSKELNWSVEKVEKTLSLEPMLSTTSLHAEPEREEEKELEPAERIPRKGSVSEVAEARELMRVLYDGINKLPPQERSVIVRTWGLFGNEAVTQEQLAKEMGVHPKTVSRLEKRARERLKNNPRLRDII